MAYIYEFSFLCEGKHQAEKLAWYLSDSYVPGQWILQIGGQHCKIYVEGHNETNGDDEYDKYYWVSVIPYTENNIKWPSGGVPEEDLEESTAFESAMYNEIDKFNHKRIDFLYASPGVEVTGFRDKDEIIELLKSDCELPGSIINWEMWTEADCPLNWKGTYNTNFLRYHENN